MDTYEVTTNPAPEPQTTDKSADLLTPNKGHWKEISVGISALCLVLALGYTAFDSMYLRSTIVQNEQAMPTPKPFTLTDDAIIAKAAVVYDPITRTVLYAKNPEVQLPLASLTKLATAHAVLTARGRDQIVVIQEDALKQEGNSNLRAGDVWRLADLLAFGLTTSSNDAMAAVATIVSEEGLVSRMNNEAQKNGLSQSYFLNETGLDVSSSTAGAYGSALDVATLVLNLIKNYPDIFEATAYAPRAESGSGEGAVSTLEPIWDIPGLIGAKTGYTDLAGGNVAVAVDLGLSEPVIAVVLGSTREGRFEDVRTLIEAARQNKLSNSF